MSKFKFEKFLYGVALNGIFIAKYRDANNRIKLVLEDKSFARTPDISTIFDTESEYQEFFTASNIEDDVRSNEAACMNTLIKAIHERIHGSNGDN